VRNGIVNLSKLAQFECITLASKPLRVRNPGRPETGTKHANAVKLTMPVGSRDALSCQSVLTQPRPKPDPRKRGKCVLGLTGAR
jgi:hypothetical protein